MIRLVHEATRFSDDRLPHAFDDEQHAHIHYLTSVAIESNGAYYLVDLRGQYFVFEIQATAVNDITSHEAFARLSWGLGHPQAWAKALRTGRGSALAGIAPSQNDPTVARRVLREAVILSDITGRALPDGQRRMVEVTAGVGTVITAGMLGRRSPPGSSNAGSVTSTFANEYRFSDAASEPTVLEAPMVRASLPETRTFRRARDQWDIATVRQREIDVATGETYFITRVSGSGPEMKRLAADYLLALSPGGDPGRTEQVLIPDVMRDYTKTTYELHTLATLAGTPVADARTWAERKGGFETRDADG